jgi:hypothetical protein
MTDVAKIGSNLYPSFTAAVAALKTDATPQLLEILNGTMGAVAFGAVQPGPNAVVTISGAVGADGSLPELKALGTFVRLAWGKAIINVEGVGNLTIQNLLLTNAASSGMEGNGAGIRVNAGAVETHVKNVDIQNCENGILGAGFGKLYIENSSFDKNGQSANPDRRGYSHNVYLDGMLVSAYRSSFTNSAFGHDFKSRAKETRIERCLLEGSNQGRALDLSNGGILYSKGNKYIKHADAIQNNLLHIAPEGIPDGRAEKYESFNDLFQIDIPFNGRELQFVKNDGNVEMVLTDPKFVMAGTELSLDDARRFLSGNVRVVYTGGAVGPQEEVGRPANVVAPQNPVVPEPAPHLGDWQRAGVEGDSFNSPANTKVRYGIEGAWIEKTVTGAWTASNEFFANDPAPGVSKLAQIWVPVAAPVVAPPAPVVPVVEAPAAPVGTVPSGDLAVAMVAAATAFLKSFGYTVTK